MEFARGRCLALALTVSLSLAGAAAVAARPAGEPFQLSSDASNGSRFAPGAVEVASLRDGRQFAVWMQPADTSGGYRVWGRALSATGAPLAEAMVLSGETADGTLVDAAWPAVAADGRRGFLVLWSQQQPGDEQRRIVALRVSAAGVPASQVVDLGAAGDGPQVVYNSLRHEFFAVWQTPGARATRALRLTRRGLPAGRRVRLTPKPAAGDGLPFRSPDVAYSRDENAYLVVWDGDAPDSKSALYGRLVRATRGQRARPVRRLTPAVDAAVLHPEVAYSPRRAEFLLASSRDGRLMLSRVRADGRAVGRALHVDGSDEGYAGPATLAATAGGRHVIAYDVLINVGRETFGRAALYRGFGPRLRFRRARGAYLDDEDCDSRSPTVAGLRRGFTVAWVQGLSCEDDATGQSQRGQPDRYEIFARHITPAE